MNDPYVEFVREEARKIGKEFFIESGEGNECLDMGYDWYIEDMSGWLVEVSQVEAFKEARKRDAEYEEFGDDFVFAEWKKDSKGRLLVDFVKYPSF